MMIFHHIWNDMNNESEWIYIWPTSIQFDTTIIIFISMISEMIERIDLDAIQWEYSMTNEANVNRHRMNKKDIIVLRQLWYDRFDDAKWGWRLLQDVIDFFDFCKDTYIMHIHALLYGRYMKTCMWRFNQNDSDFLMSDYYGQELFYFSDGVRGHMRQYYWRMICTLNLHSFICRLWVRSSRWFSGGCASFTRRQSTHLETTYAR